MFFISTLFIDFFRVCILYWVKRFFEEKISSGGMASARARGVARFSEIFGYA